MIRHGNIFLTVELQLLHNRIDVPAVRCIDDGLDAQFSDLFNESNGFIDLFAVMIGAELLMVVDDKGDVLTFDFTNEDVRVIHAEAVGAVKHHVVIAAVDSCCCDGHHRKVVIFDLADFVDVLAQEPVVNTEVTAPSCNQVGFIDNDQT